MRTIDENKIAQLEFATAEFVVKNGYGGASVGKIAKQAGVSKGYLYRFYKTKQELVQALLSRYISFIVEDIENNLKQDVSTDIVLERLIKHIFDTAEKSPVHLKFVYVLMHDYNFQLKEEEREKIRRIVQCFYDRGKAQKTVGTSVKAEEIFTIAVVYPIDFINLRFKEFFKTRAWTDKDIKRVTEFSINALRN